MAELELNTSGGHGVNQLQLEKYLEASYSTNPWITRRLSLSIGGNIGLEFIESHGVERVSDSSRLLKP